MVDFLPIDHSELGLEADRYGDYPHPREMFWLGGHAEQERILLEAFQSGKLHHAWLFTGPEGIGKATMAYRFSRFLLAQVRALVSQDKPVSLFIGESNPVSGQVARQSHADLSVIRRGLTKDGKSLRTETSVDAVRDALGVFRTTAGAGGWRIIIVDSVDDLNRNGANALLKMLEEPPENALFILISHNPGSLLPTIRSRCRTLRFFPLAESIVSDGLQRLSEAALSMIAAAAAESQGSLRQALAQLDPTMASISRDVSKILLSPEKSNGKAIRQLLEKTNGKAGEKAFEAVMRQIEDHLRMHIKQAQSTHAPKHLMAARAEIWEKLRRSAGDIETYNLDRRPFLLSLFAELAEIDKQPTQ